MSPIERPTDLLALIPYLRAFARTLTADPVRADALVRDGLAGTLADWRPSPSADAVRVRIEAMIAAAADAEQAGDGGSVRLTGT